ncbi:MAG: DNA2/NAM7 family helicase [Prevotella sp.]|nr:DNA2/NAM7 family helicase [Prevotella sp.]
MNSREEEAKILFDELLDAVRVQSFCRRAYRQLNRTFLRCLDRKTAIAGIRFGGPFAKTDYVLKEYHAPRRLFKVVHDARVRLRQQDRLTDEELAENFAYDLKAVAQLIGLLWQTHVPDELSKHFPADRTATATVRLPECMRMVVDRWDTTYIYGHADTPGADDVKVHYGGKTDKAAYPDWDWSSLRSQLSEGCQLNLVRPRESDGVLYPELIIYEPDYLVDISAVAACFESYGATHLNHLIGKLKPAQNTQAIVLGNMAGQLLDEQLRLYPADQPYSESAREFFQKNALSLLACAPDDDFHQQAMQQKQHIRNVIGHVLPTALQSDGIAFNASEVMVEPSFFSEMLGLQGRMDFLQLDMRVLIEQKSGKGGFPQQDPDTPVQQSKHYVQLLLYMLLLRYNYREQYERNQRRLHAFLLYSRYTRGLLSLGFAPKLMLEAIQMRNAIAAAEYSYSRGGLDVLLRLTPDDLNTSHTRGTLWQQYQRPQLEALLAPIGAASPLERAYYLRMLTFVETEHLMAKVGNQTKENAGFADKWHSSLADKRLAGNIYDGLELVSPQPPTPDSHQSTDTVVLNFKERPDHDISNFRKGDIVILYPYDQDSEPDARRTMVFRATLTDITTTTLTLRLRATQVDACVFWHDGKRLWAIEHDFMEASSASLYRGVHAFLSAPKERRDLLMLQRRPAVDNTLTLRGDYGSFNELALRAKQARDLFIIIGPPGTGKTSYGLMNTLHEELLSSNDPVLLLSYTNRAVEEICSKLVESGLDFLRIGGRNSADETYRSYLLDERVKNCHNTGELRQLISDTRIFVGTTTALNSNIHLFQLKQFGLAIIDEASQILEPHLLGLLSATSPDGACAIRKMMLIGDHKQLPAVVQQGEEEALVTDEVLKNIHLTSCRQSLFQRLLTRYRDDPSVVYMLTHQGRMHHDIALFPSQAFYQGRLKEVPLPHQLRPLDLTTNGSNGIEHVLRNERIAFMAVEPQADGTLVSDKVNTAEAKTIAAAVETICRLAGETFSATQTVGVIVPYRNQIAEVRNCIAQSGIDGLTDITIDTVERYQGSQRDYIVYGFTIQKPYQLDFLADNTFEEDGSTIDRKLNVAMTRAREHLLLVGNPVLLARNATFARLLKFLKDRHAYYETNQINY